jgi:hypothetical protein
MAVYHVSSTEAIKRFSDREVVLYVRIQRTLNTDRQTDGRRRDKSNL